MSGSIGTWDDPAVVAGRGSLISLLKGLGLATGGAAVTPSDTEDLPKMARSLYVGGAGAVKVDTADGSTLVFSAVPVGTLLPVAVKRVYADGTAATLILALYSETQIHPVQE